MLACASYMAVVALAAVAVAVAVLVSEEVFVVMLFGMASTQLRWSDDLR